MISSALAPVLSAQLRTAPTGRPKQRRMKERKSDEMEKMVRIEEVMMNMHAYVMNRKLHMLS